MNTQARRYVFIDYANLQQVRYKKLEKVASRMFVFIEAQQDMVPLSLVRQTQRAGKNLRWIVVTNSLDGRLNYHIAFIMGKLHQKLESDVEFAVVSNDADFDPLVSFINASGRSCIRVKRRQEETTLSTDTTVDYQAESSTNDIPLGMLGDEDSIDVLVEDEIIGRTAEETVKRLIRSGNRPAEVATLKNYILLHNQELSLHGHIDRIISKMKEAKDIEIHKGEVVYNF